MARKKSTSNTRAPKGQGSIKQRTVTRNGKTYTSWRARCYILNPDTNLPELKEFSGATQKEALQKMKEAQRQVDDGTYQPKKVQYTLGQWLDLWAENYLNGVKPYTVASYKGNIKNHFKPSPIAKVKLSQLTPLQIQKMYNSLVNKATGEKLSPKTMKNVHGTLHKALQVAVDTGLLRQNPADHVSLERVIPKEIKPLNEKEVADFLNAIKGSQYADLYTVTLFCGLRQGEVCGLSWDCVDFKAGSITIKQQLQFHKSGGGSYFLLPTKNSKPRTILPAPSIMALLQSIKNQQFLDMCAIGHENWKNEWNLVFTQKDGSHFCPQTVYEHFKRIVATIGRPDARFHDLRHTFAVLSLKNGDDIKVVQDTLGHATASFTLQIYAHATEEMKKASSNRMEAYITSQQLKIG